MLLVPRQLQRSGMTGAVPYYGGRLTPAQAYAASHPQGAPPNQSPTAWNPVATAAAAPPQHHRRHRLHHRPAPTPRPR